MAGDSAWRSATRIASWVAGAVAMVSVVGAVSIVASGWMIEGVEQANGSRRIASERSAMGDYFGAVSAIFSGLALLLLIATLVYQQRELRLQRLELGLQRGELKASRDELRRSAEADMNGLHIQLTQMAMDDPALAEVWIASHDQSESAVRQHLFANLVFNHFLLARSWGTVSDSDLLAHAHDLLRNPAFQQYWETARTAKSRISSTSPEGRLVQLFDQALADLRREPPASAS
ncbi:DUF6082 family protein [Streptomyces sp. NPDC001815]|uniref:DUF6082 family protein n=1 Tax=unclassified Streptomyces TaxID=2593676 RepID=UPI00331AD8E7